MDKVEEMLKKQEDFEKMLVAQEDRFHLLNRETKVKLGGVKKIIFPLKDSGFGSFKFLSWSMLPIFLY